MPFVLKHFQPQTFTTADDEIKFDRAWKNGIWHCLAPVSFDLASPESIRDKAHKWLGQITSVDSADLKLYFLVGEPSQADLKPVYQSALNILKKASSSAEVFTETDAASLSLRLAAQVAQHEANARMPERREALAFQPPLPRLIWRPASRSSRIPIWVIFTPAPAPSSQQTPPHAERPLP